MADDDDVAHLQDLDGELHHRKTIQVRVDDDVCHVAMDEHLAGKKADDLVGWHATVGAADPQVARRLLPRQFEEKIWVPLPNAFGPCLVVGKEMIEVGHQDTCRRLATIDLSARASKRNENWQAGFQPACRRGFDA